MQTKQTIPVIADLYHIGSGDHPPPFREARARFEQAYFENLLQITGGNISKAARLSGLTRQNIYTHIKRFTTVTKS